MLPTFICIGAQKTGTTWLYNQLIQHPQVFLSKTKELNFFNRDLEPTRYEWYFRGAAETQTLGDISPNYMVLPGVAERMYALLPHARLICILREPVARAKSQYQMAVRLGNIPKDTPFIEAFRGNLQYIKERGCYTKLLDRFTQLYSKDQILIKLYDELVDDPEGFLRSIEKHIGVDDNFIPANYDQRIYAGESQLSLTEEEEGEIRDYYVAHVMALEAYLGHHLKNWFRQA